MRIILELSQSAEQLLRSPLPLSIVYLKQRDGSVAVLPHSIGQAHLRDGQKWRVSAVVSQFALEPKHTPSLHSFLSLFPSLMSLDLPPSLLLSLGPLTALGDNSKVYRMSKWFYTSRPAACQHTLITLGGFLARQNVYCNDHCYDNMVSGPHRGRLCLLLLTARQ